MHALAQLIGPEARLVVVATALGFMILEYFVARLADRDAHDLRETTASLIIAVGQNLIRGLEAVVVAVPFTLVYQHRLFSLDQTGALSLAALFLATEFVYYWHHRAAHRVRWLWATHSVHHSPTKLNLTAAVRLGWTGNISGNFLFFLPLVWIGFHPFAVVGMLGFNLLYQFFIHTEFGTPLGPLEWVLNTPAHHRVHHASNPSCIDKNYGGILIVFDRMFGTFAEAPKDEPLRYGVPGGQPSNNPVRIAFAEWMAMFCDVRNALNWRARLHVLFGPPGSTRQVKTSAPRSGMSDEPAE